MHAIKHLYSSLVQDYFMYIISGMLTISTYGMARQALFPYFRPGWVALTESTISFLRVFTEYLQGLDLNSVTPGKKHLYISYCGTATVTHIIPAIATTCHADMCHHPCEIQGKITGLIQLLL